MGIPPEILAKPVNKHILMRGDQTLAEALLALKNKAGQEWWFLVVEVAPLKKYLAARFSDLRPLVKAQAQVVLSLPLDQIGEPLTEVSTVQQEADLETAEALAEQSPMLVVVVLSDSMVSGIVSVGGTRSAGLIGEPSLLDLAGFVEAGSDLPPAKVSPPPSAATPAPAAPPQSSPAINVGVNGNVADGGQVIVAGNDVNIYQVAAEQQTKEQARRFEAAFPQETNTGHAEKLQVAVLLPGASSPFGDQDNAQAIAKGDEVMVALPVDSKTGELKSVEIEVAVTAPGFRIQGDAKKHLTVFPDGRTQTRWFLLEPLEAGKKEIMLELSQGGRLLQEISLKTEVFAPETKTRSMLNLSLKVATFSLQFNFATG